MRVLIVGYGSMGKRHASNAAALGHAVYVYDASPSAYDDAEHAWTATPDEAIATEPDAVVIATPATEHAFDFGWLSSNCPDAAFLVEKPLDVDLGNAEMWEGWKGATACVGYNWRFVPRIATMRVASDVSVEALGDMARADEVRLSLTTRTDMRRWPGAYYGGLLLECSHDIDLALWLVNADRRSSFRAERSEKAWHLTMESEAGDRAEIEIVDESPVQQREVELHTTFTAATALIDLDTAEGLELVEASYREEMRRFLFAAERGEAVADAATFLNGLAVLQVVERAQELDGLEALRHAKGKGGDWVDCSCKDCRRKRGD